MTDRDRYVLLNFIWTVEDMEFGRIYDNYDWSISTVTDTTLTRLISMRELWIDLRGA